MKRTYGWLLILAAVAACKRAASEGAGPGGGGGGPPAMPVEVAVAASDTVVDAVAANGAIQAIQSIDLRPEVEGRIVQIVVNEGSLVGAGTVLFRVDDAELAARVAQAEAERDLAVQDRDRTRQLQQQQASAAADVERTDANARKAEAALNVLQLQLARTAVRAPFAGLVGQRYVSLGDYVTKDTKLASLQTVNPQWAVFQVPERYAQRLKIGQRVTFRVAALPQREFTGVVSFIDPNVQQPNRSILVKAGVPNGSRELRPGMYIDVRLALEVRPKAVVVPEDAILPLQGANFVWVVTDGKAARRQVGLGVRTPGFVEITSGVDAGEKVVVGGQERLFEGAAVMAKEVDRKPARPVEG